MHTESTYTLIDANTSSLITKEMGIYSSYLEGFMFDLNQGKAFRWQKYPSLRNETPSLRNEGPLLRNDRVFCKNVTLFYTGKKLDWHNVIEYHNNNELFKHFY